MNFSWPLLSVLGGYLFVTRCYLTRYDAQRASGYHIFFRSAIAGAFLHVPAVCGMIALSCLFQHSQLSCFAKWSFFTSSIYPCLAILSFVSGLVLPVIVNHFLDGAEITKDVARKNGDLIELLLIESMEGAELVEFSLKNRKVYIGFVLNYGSETKDGEFDVELLPLISGYRHIDTLDLIVTTSYDSTMAKGFSIIIPMAEIVSARLFDPADDQN